MKLQIESRNDVITAHGFRAGRTQMCEPVPYCYVFMSRDQGGMYEVLTRVSDGSVADKMRFDTLVDARKHYSVQRRWLKKQVRP